MAGDLLKNIWGASLTTAQNTSATGTFYTCPSGTITVLKRIAAGRDFYTTVASGTRLRLYHTRASTSIKWQIFDTDTATTFMQDIRQNTSARVSAWQGINQDSYYLHYMEAFVVLNAGDKIDYTYSAGPLAAASNTISTICHGVEST